MSAPAVEPLFPAELRRRTTVELCLPGPVATWHRPVTLDRLLHLKQEHPDAKLVVGNTGALRGTRGPLGDYMAAQRL